VADFAGDGLPLLLWLPLPPALVAAPVVPPCGVRWLARGALDRPGSAGVVCAVAGGAVADPGVTTAGGVA